VTDRRWPGVGGECWPAVAVDGRQRRANGGRAQEKTMGRRVGGTGGRGGHNPNDGDDEQGPL
jgi:hypothetical protein